jgi:hypothetical protein
LNSAIYREDYLIIYNSTTNNDQNQEKEEEFTEYNDIPKG